MIFASRGLEDELVKKISMLRVGVGPAEPGVSRRYNIADDDR